MKWFLPLVIAFACCFGSANAQNNGASQKSPIEVCNQFQPQIQKLADDKQYLDAVKLLEEYEQALLKLYPAPVFNRGVYQNNAQHITVHSGFDGWKEQPKQNLQVPMWMRITGLEILFGLEGPGDDQKFVISAVDPTRVERRLGQPTRRLDSIPDEELIQNLRQVAAALGPVQTQEFKTFSNRRMILAELRGRAGVTIQIAITGANHGIYRFVLVTSEAKQAEDQKKFFKTLENVAFDFKPANAEKIQGIRNATKDNDIRSSLAQTRELVLAGEYGAAVDDLAHVRMLFGQSMPGPQIQGNVATHPLYGISLKNPDPQKWKLAVTNQAGIGLLMLEDRLSVESSGLAVMVMNTVMMFGPEFVEAVINNGDENLKKQVMTGAGRGALGKVGSKLESESFRIFRGELAYQGVAIGRTANSKVKQILTANSDYLLMIAEMGNDPGFDAKCKEYEDIIDKNLELKRNADEKSPKQ